MRPPPADSQRHQMTNGGTFVRFVLHFQNVAGGKKKVNIEINIQHQRNRLGKSLKRQKKVFPHGDICNSAGQLNS